MQILKLKTHWMTLLGIASLFAFAMMTFHLPLASTKTMLHGDTGDGRLVILFLEHSYRFVLGDWITDYWSAPWNFHPYPLTIAMSEPMAGNVFIYGPLRLLGLSIEEAGKWWIIATSALNFLSCFVFFRLIGGKTVASMTAAYLFCYSMIRLQYMNHPHLFPHYPTMLAFLTWIWMTRAQVLSSQIILGSISGFCLAWQFWCSLHLGWFAFFGTFVCCCFSILLPNRRHLINVLIENRWGVIAMGVMFAVTLWPLYSKMTEFRAENGAAREFSDTAQFMLKSVSYVFPADATAVYRWLWAKLQNRIGSGEINAFMGFMPLLVALFAPLWMPFTLKKERTLLAALAAISALGFLTIVVICTRDIYGKQAWLFFHTYFPGANGIRAIGRISILQCFFMSLIVCFVITQIENSKFRLFSLLFLLIGVFENYSSNFYAFSEEDNQKSIAAFAASVREVCVEPHDVLFYSSAIDDPYNTTLTMWYAMQYRVPVANGYSGYKPPGFNLKQKSDREDVVQWFAQNGKSLDASKVCIVR